MREARYMRKRAIRTALHLARYGVDEHERLGAAAAAMTLNAIRKASRFTGEHKQTRFDYELGLIPARTAVQFEV